ncbi:MAG: lysylphosphatidylglycerol synthase transmembrane domain-containing protein [Haliea sp.]
MPKSGKRAASLIWHLVALAVVAAAAWHFIDFHDLWTTLRRAQWHWLYLLLALATLDRFLMAGKWHQLLRQAGNSATFPLVLNAYYQAAILQRLFPTSLGGDAVRAIIISGRAGGTSGVVATMVVEKLVAMLAAVFIAISGALLALSDGTRVTSGTLVAVIPLLLVLTLVGLRISLHRPLVEWFIGWIPGQRLRRGLLGVYNDYAGFRNAPGVLFRNFLYCIVEQAVQVALLLGCAMALQVDASISTLIAAISIAQCLRKFAILLEGWLLGEFTMVFICSLFGVPESQALAFSLLGHAVAVVAATPGLLLFARSTVRLRDIKTREGIQ